MGRSTVSPLLPKSSARYSMSSNAKSKTKSSIAAELFRREGGPAKRRVPLMSKPSASNHAMPRILAKPRIAPLSYSHSHKQRVHWEDNSDSGNDLAANDSRKIARRELEEAGDDVSKSCSDLGESDEEDEADWLDESTLIAPYQEEKSETEEDRALALVEYLQVPMQEKSNALKQDLCNVLISTVNEIRQAQDKLEHGADVDRGKGIIIFNDTCDKRHVEVARVHAQLKDAVVDNQADIMKLFVQLKRAYDHRSQLWDNLKARIDEITGQQAAVLDQLDDNIAQTLVNLEKRSKAMLKDDSGKDNEKLLRGVLGRL